MLGVAALAVVAFAAVSYLVVYPIVYYLYDPKGLRKYPNYSWLSPITDFRHCYLSSTGTRSKGLVHEHRKRGEPILRIGPNSLSFLDSRAIKDIYGHTTKCIKDENYNVLSGSHRHLFDVVDKPEHARKRKLLSAAFAIKNLEKWEFKVAYTAERLFKAFDERCGAPPKSPGVPDPTAPFVDFNHWINLWTIEAINFITLSTKMDLLDTGTDEVIAERQDGTLYRARYRLALNRLALVQAVFVWDYKLWPWVQWLTKTLPTKWKKIWEDGEPWDDIQYHLTHERLKRYEAGEELDDFFSCLMDDKNGAPNNLAWGEIVNEVGAIINAGSDTTAVALTHVLELLIQHPKHMETLRKEVDGVLDEDEVICSYDKVKDLPFLKACIDETLRVSPPVAAGLPRRTPAEGARILDEWVAGDISVNMTIWGAHRDPAVFKNPEVFDPTRWLDPEERRRMEPFFMPFSTGARGCIGRNISYLEQIMMLASLVHRYEFAFPTPDWKLGRTEAFNILCHEMPLKIWRRDLDN